MTEAATTKELDECRFCGKPLADHEDSRPAGAPVPKTPCLLLKEHFVARVVNAEPAPRPPALERREPFPILRYFAYEHLPPKMQEVSRPFAELARACAATLPPGPETSAGLRKLLEAKDCFVRASLP